MNVCPPALCQYWGFVLTATALLIGCSMANDPRLAPAEYSYPADAILVCTAPPRTGGAGVSDGFEFANGFRANVRTPSNYRATYAHPLLVVYAAAGQSATDSERLVGLTREATARGYVVAYAGSRRLGLKSLRMMTTLPTAISAQWCIDQQRIYATGHSDGATTAVASVLLPGVALRPHALAASAAGFAASDLVDMQCPTPTPAMLIQKRDDTLFPDYVRQLARWWAKCNGCTTKLLPASGACSAFASCPVGAATIFCEVAGGHKAWPELNPTVLDFLENSGTSIAYPHDS